jgi:hypothetical protein
MNTPDGDPINVVDVEDVDSVVLVVTSTVVVVASTVVVVTSGLHTVGSASQALCTASTQARLHCECSEPRSSAHSESTHASISSRHALRPHSGGAAMIDGATTAPANAAANNDLRKRTISMW